MTVVATATGGIPEVVVDGETGWLVPIEQVTGGSGPPVDPDRFVSDLARALNQALGDPGRARRFGQAGRRCPRLGDLGAGGRRFTPSRRRER